MRYGVCGCVMICVGVLCSVCMSDIRDLYYKCIMLLFVMCIYCCMLMCIFAGPMHYCACLCVMFVLRDCLQLYYNMYILGVRCLGGDVCDMIL